ncbi:MAG: hypothetical protein E7377_02365 [Clostridiales bacterium]|nr:hypothetical protein [Clostridiales bacterium]
MEEQIQTEEGISLIDLIRVLLNKLKLLILVVLIGGFAGAAFAVWRTIDVNYYGTTVEFYVNPEKPKGATGNLASTTGGSQYGVYGAYGRHVMDNMVKLLSSESFAEQLMLEENGLPDKTIYAGLNEEDYASAEASLVIANKAWDAADLLEEPRIVAMEKLNEEWTKAGKSGTFNEASYYELFNKGEAPDSLIRAYQEAIAATDARNEARANASALQEKADEDIEKVLSTWRETYLYQSTLSRFKGAVSYSYLGELEDVEDANNLARSFIYVKISVLNDKDFARDLLNRVKRVVPIYVEKNMAVPSDYEGTNCQRITRSDEIALTNPSYTKNQAIKFGVLAAAAAGIIAAILVILVDKSDKRLRDYEIITKNFDVPVLGVVPTIEELASTADTKLMKTEGKK